MSEPTTFVKISRSLPNWEWYKDANTMRVFIHLLIKANYNEGNFKGVLIKRGEVVTSYKSIADELGITEKNARTAINHLKQTGSVASTKYSKFQVIKLNNYDKFQSSRQADWQASGRQTAGNGQASGNNQRNKESKKLRNKEINSISTKNFVPPTLEEVKAYCSERNNGVDADHFFDYYSANGWVQGAGNPIADWQACIRTWERRGFRKPIEDKPSFDLKSIEKEMIDSDGVC
ncbi:MAG: hypothetical protein IKL18_00090 [Oscillospiraceae bacterium]|nr:hypothetical protein [Oscillospiraceae bacterium]